jgi:hypothetical protein
LDFLFPAEPLLDTEPLDFFFLLCSLDEEGVVGLEVFGVDAAVVAVFRKNNWSKIDDCCDLVEPFPDIVDELKFNAKGEIKNSGEDKISNERTVTLEQRVLKKESGQLY